MNSMMGAPSEIISITIGIIVFFIAMPKLINIIGSIFKIIGSLFKVRKRGENIDK